MNKQEIQLHRRLKKKLPNYPALPKFIIHASDKKYKDYPDGLKASCLRGFTKRLNNWLKNPNNYIEWFKITGSVIQEDEVVETV